MRLCISTDSIDVDEKATSKENSPIFLWANNNVGNAKKQSYSGFLSNATSPKSSSSDTADHSINKQVRPKKKYFFSKLKVYNVFSWSNKEKPCTEDIFLRTVKSFDTEQYSKEAAYFTDEDFERSIADDEDNDHSSPASSSLDLDESKDSTQFYETLRKQAEVEKHRQSMEGQVSKGIVQQFVQHALAKEDFIPMTSLSYDSLDGHSPRSPPLLLSATDTIATSSPTQTTTSTPIAPQPTTPVHPTERHLTPESLSQTPQSTSLPPTVPRSKDGLRPISHNSVISRSSSTGNLTTPPLPPSNTNTTGGREINRNRLQALESDNNLTVTTIMTISTSSSEGGRRYTLHREDSLFQKLFDENHQNTNSAKTSAKILSNNTGGNKKLSKSKTLSSFSFGIGMSRSSSTSSNDLNDPQGGEEAEEKVSDDTSSISSIEGEKDVKQVVNTTPFSSMKISPNDALSESQHSYAGLNALDSNTNNANTNAAVSGRNVASRHPLLHIEVNTTNTATPPALSSSSIASSSTLPSAKSMNSNSMSMATNPPSSPTLRSPPHSPTERHHHHNNVNPSANSPPSITNPSAGGNGNTNNDLKVSRHRGISNRSVRTVTRLNSMLINPEEVMITSGGGPVVGGSAVMNGVYLVDSNNLARQASQPIMSTRPLVHVVPRYHSSPFMPNNGNLTGGTSFYPNASFYPQFGTTTAATTGAGAAGRFGLSSVNSIYGNNGNHNISYYHHHYDRESFYQPRLATSPDSALPTTTNNNMGGGAGIASVMEDSFYYPPPPLSSSLSSSMSPPHSPTSASPPAIHGKVSVFHRMSSSSDSVDSSAHRKSGTSTSPLRGAMAIHTSKPRYPSPISLSTHSGSGGSQGSGNTIHTHQSVNMNKSHPLGGTPGSPTGKLLGNKNGGNPLTTSQSMLGMNSSPTRIR